MSGTFEMSDDERRELVAEFLSESDQHIQKLNELLLKAEDTVKGGKEMSAEDINTMFRAAHTVKGTSSFLGFKNINRLTHEMETILDRVRNKQMPLTLHVIDVLFMAFDNLEKIMEELRSSGTETADIEASVAKIKAILSGEVEPAKPAEVAAPIVVEPVQEPVKGPREFDVNKYIGAFIEDAELNINRFNQILLEMEKEKFNAEHMNELFRISHTIKGSSGIVKSKEIEKVAHCMEDLLSLLRDKQATLTEKSVSVLFKAIDAIKYVTECLKNGKVCDQDFSALLKEIADLIEAQKSGAVEKSVASAVVASGADDKTLSLASLTADERDKLGSALAEDTDLFQITILIQAGVGLKSMKAMLAEERLRKIGKILKYDPASEKIDDTKKEKLVIRYLIASVADEKDIRLAVSIDQVDLVSLEREDKSKWKEARKPAVVAAPVQEVKMETIKAPKVDAAAVKVAEAAKAQSVELATIRIDSRKLDKLMNLAGELVITRARFAQQVSALSEEIVRLKEVTGSMSELGSKLNELKALSTRLRREEGEDSVKNLVRMDKVFNEIDTKFGILDQKIGFKGISSKVYSLDEATDALGKLSSDIQSGIMQTRMVPVEGLFTRFKRVVRDIAKDLGKEVTLELFGEETELDKKIIDDLNDPLTHMIRNAVDHGIESKKDRLAAGKSEMGTVKLGASHRGNNICIEISDDGKGLDGDKLAQKAMEKGLITADKAAQMSEKEKLNLIFLPGFSTAEKVTGLSGRGVGMDVVRSMIESLKGSVDITTTVGHGSTFVMKIPLTLAIIQALLVEVGNEVHAFPLESVAEIIKITAGEIYYIEGNPTVKLRDHALSLVELESVISVGGKKRDVKESKKVVVITDGNNRLGVIVDDLIGEDEIVIKALTDHFANVKGISGASILGDGRIALILDPATILKQAQ